MVGAHIAMASTLENNLQALGLAPKEAAVYLALLQLGQAPVQTIARKANIVRPTTYVVLEALIQKGIVRKGFIGKKTVFIASPPEELTTLLHQVERRLEEERKNLERVLPELRAIYAISDERPSIRLFEGREGLKNLQREFVEISTEPIISVSAYDDMDELFAHQSEKYYRDIQAIRTAAGIRSRYVYASSEGPLFTPEDDRIALRESRWISSKKLPVRSSFSIHGPLVSLVTFHNKIIGVLIEHKDIADSFRAMFEVLWAIAEPRIQQVETAPASQKVRESASR